MKPSLTDDILRRAAARAAADSFFLGSALQTYRELNELDEVALAADLGCSWDDLPRLALCRRPSTESPEFKRDVERIAEYASVKAERLAGILREVVSIETLQTADSDASAPTRGLLMAARDRLEETEERRESRGGRGRSRRDHDKDQRK